MRLKPPETVGKQDLGLIGIPRTAGGTKTANTVVDMTATGNELLGTIIQMLTPAVMLTTGGWWTLYVGFVFYRNNWRTN